MQRMQEMQLSFPSEDGSSADIAPTGHFSEHMPHFVQFSFAAGFILLLPRSLYGVLPGMLIFSTTVMFSSLSAIFAEISRVFLLKLVVCQKNRDYFFFMSFF